MTNNERAAPVPIHHDGVKPEWLSPNDLVIYEGHPRCAWAHGWSQVSADLPADHWAAAPILAGLEPFNAEMQGRDEPKDRKLGGKIMWKSGLVEPRNWPAAARLVIGYERAAQAGEGCNDPNCIATGPHNFCQPTPAADHAKPGRDGEEWRCPACKCHSYAEVSGSPGLVRCINCKRTFSLATRPADAMLSEMAAALEGLLSGEIDVSGTALIYEDLADVCSTGQAALAAFRARENG